MIARLRLISVALCAAIMLGGCGTLPPPIDAAQITPLKDGYILAAGDRVRITVFNEANLTGEYNVTSQGMIAFPLIGTVPASGRTTDQITEAVRTRLAAGYFNDPRVSTEVLSYRPYFILGEVAKPGEYPFTNGLTVEQAIAAAGGFTYRANRGKVILRRQNSDERSVDLDDAPVQVLPGDTIRIAERYF